MPTIKASKRNEEHIADDQHDPVPYTMSTAVQQVGQPEKCQAQAAMRYCKGAHTHIG